MLTGGQAQIAVQPAEDVESHQGDLSVVVICQPVLADDIDVGLGELAVAALLRAFTSPDLLHLVAAERKVEVSGVLQHVTGERHRQIEVKAKLVGLPGLSMQAPDDVYLLVDLSFAGQLPERLNCPGLDGGEAMKLEGGSDGTEYLVLDQAPAGRNSGKPEIGLGRAMAQSFRNRIAGRGW